MAYFKPFPVTSYEFLGQRATVLDIFRRCAFISEYKPYSDLYTTYTILEGETPESIALREYGSVNYFWVVLIFNEIHSMYTDWPLPTHIFEEYCATKYSSELNNIKHYERDGLVIGEVVEFIPGEEYTPPVNPGPLDPTVFPVSFYDYETAENEKKRTIHLLRVELLGDFVNQFEQAINE